MYLPISISTKAAYAALFHFKLIHNKHLGSPPFLSHHVVMWRKKMQ